MKRYYRVVWCSRAKKNPYVYGITNLNEFGYRENDFYKAQYISNLDNKVYVKPMYDESYGDLDDALQGTMVFLPILSKKVVDEFNKSEIKGFQYIPINVICEDNRIEKNYFIANCLNIVEAFDFKNSNYIAIKDTSFGKYVETMEELEYPFSVFDRVLCEEKVEGLDVFRLKEEGSRTLIVSDEIRKIFIKNKFTGWGFQSVKLSRNGIVFKDNKSKRNHVKEIANKENIIKDKNILESGIIAEIASSGLEKINYYILNNNEIVLTVENKKFKQKFMMKIRNNKFAEESKKICCKILSYIWNYSKKNSIKVNDICDIELCNYPPIYAVFDRYVFNSNNYIIVINIKQEEIVYSEQHEDFNIINELKNANIYPISDFKRNSIV